MGPSGAHRTQVSHMLAPWTLLSWMIILSRIVHHFIIVCVVWVIQDLDYLGRWHYREWTHHFVGVLFSDLADEQGAHSGPGAAPQGVCDLETLQTVTVLNLFSRYIQNRIHHVCALYIMTPGPAISSTILTDHEVVWAVDLAIRTWPDRVHGAWFQVHQDGTGDVFAAWGMTCKILVTMDALTIQIYVGRNKNRFHCNCYSYVHTYW